MNDQEAKLIIDSQPGSNLSEKETNAKRILNQQEDVAQTSFFQTLTTLTEHYSDTTHLETIDMQDFLHATRNFADKQERLEAITLLQREMAKVELSIARSRALAAYINRQHQDVLA